MGLHWSLWQVSLSLSLVASPLSCPGIVGGIILAVVSSPGGGGGGDGSSDDTACSLCSAVAGTGPAGETCPWGTGSGCAWLLPWNHWVASTVALPMEEFGLL